MFQWVVVLPYMVDAVTKVLNVVTFVLISNSWDGNEYFTILNMNLSILQLMLLHALIHILHINLLMLQEIVSCAHTTLSSKLY